MHVDDSIESILGRGSLRQTGPERYARVWALASKVSTGYIENIGGEPENGGRNKPGLLRQKQTKKKNNRAGVVFFFRTNNEFLAQRAKKLQ